MTLLMLGGTSNSTTMGNPGVAKPMFKFNLIVELGRAMSKLKDSTWVIIGEKWCN